MGNSERFSKVLDDFESEVNSLKDLSGLLGKIKTIIQTQNELADKLNELASTIDLNRENIADLLSRLPTIIEESKKISGEQRTEFDKFVNDLLARLSATSEEIKIVSDRQRTEFETTLSDVKKTIEDVKNTNENNQQSYLLFLKQITTKSLNFLTTKQENSESAIISNFEKTVHIVQTELQKFKTEQLDANNELSVIKRQLDSIKLWINILLGIVCSLGLVVIIILFMK